MLFQERMLDLPPVRLFMVTGTSWIVIRGSFNSSKFDTGSGYSSGYSFAKREITDLSAARNPDVGS